MGKQKSSMNKNKGRILYALFFLFVLLAIASCSEKEYKTSTKIYFGTTCTISIPSSNLAKYFKVLEDIEKKFSYRNDKSEIARINMNAGIKPVAVSEDVYNLIMRSINYSRATKGCFNPLLLPIIKLWGWDTGDTNVPNDIDIKKVLSLCVIEDIEFNDDNHSVFLKKEGMGIDLGGIVKGYAADELYKILLKDGIKEGIINLGGNVYVFGDKEFNVSIQKPYAERGVKDIIINVKNKSVVTSGAYERGFTKDGIYYHHIIDPKTGYPATENYKSVTIISENSEKADVFATAIFIGLDNLKEQLINNNPDIEVIIQ